MRNLRQDQKTCEWLGGGQTLIRIHCGLEDINALIADLK